MMRKLRAVNKINRCRAATFTACKQRNDSAHLNEGCASQIQYFSDETYIAFAPSIPAELRVRTLSPDWLYCRKCGVVPGDIDDLTGHNVRFIVGHIVDESLGGKDEISNLRSLCSTCNQGAKNITTEKPTALWLLSQIRRAGQDEQLAVLNWLQSKFDKATSEPSATP